MGVFLRSFIFVNFYFAAVGALVSFAIFLLFILTSGKVSGILFAILIFSFSLGILRFDVADQPPPSVFESEVGSRVAITGDIVDEPTLSSNNQKLVVEVRSAQAETKILLSVGFDETYKYGDRIKFIGILKKPENFITDQGKMFDYVNYLRKEGILYVMIYPEVEILSRGNGNSVKHALFLVKEKFLEKINFAISSPESLLMGGLILGERAAFSEELRQDFVDTGTIHIVALSGYNVTIVSEWFMKFLVFLPRSFAFGAGIFVIFLFVLMTGANSTAVRAGLMASLALVARATGRDYDVARALALAGLAMILINPFLLVYDVSFQLSFLATIAVIFFAPRVEKYFMWVPQKFGLRDIISVTTAAYVFVFPFILYKMGNFSLVALPANVLVLPFIPFTMGVGFVSGAAGLIWYGLSVPPGFIAYMLLHYELAVIRFLASLPFASMAIPYFPLALTIVIYAAFIYHLFGRSLKNLFAMQARPYEKKF